MNKNKLFRLFTENVNKKEVLELANKYFGGFTVFEGTGFWQSTQENSLVLEIITDKKEKINKLAQDIKQLNKQDAVFIQSVNFSSYLV